MKKIFKKITYDRIIAGIFLLTLLFGFIFALRSSIPAAIEKIERYEYKQNAAGESDTETVAAYNSDAGEMQYSFPEALIAKLSSLSGKVTRLTDEVEISIENNFYMRNKFIAVSASYNYFLGGTILSDKVLMGRDGWMFYKFNQDGDPIADYQGTNLYSDSQLKQICSHIIKQQEELKAEGSKLILLIAPNKEQIYDCYMPESYGPSCTTSRTDQLVDYLKDHTTIPVVYMKEEMREFRDQYQLYYKYDTHWNPLGAFLSEQKLLAVMGLPSSALKDHEVSATNAICQDLPNMLGMKWYFNEDKGYTLTYHGLRDKRKVLFVGDSFRLGLIPYLEADFENVTVLYKDDYKRSYVEEEKPDVVVLEWAERYSGQIGTFDIDLAD